MANFILGMNAKVYFSETLLTGSNQVAVLSGATELDNVRDLTMNLETGESDITTRANSGWRATAATLKDGSLEFEMVWKDADAGFTAVKDAWSASGEIVLAAFDGEKGTAGKEGLLSNFTITNFSRSEPLEEAITVSVTAKPSSQTEWYVVP